MKRCPVCDKVFEDSMKFCQTDGTPLVAVNEGDSEDSVKTMISNPSEPLSPTFDSFKTIVSGSFSPEEAQNSGENDDAAKTQIISRSELESEFTHGEAASEQDRDVSPPSPFGSTTASWEDSQIKEANDFTPLPSPFDESRSSGYNFSSTPFQESEPMFGSHQDSFNQSPYGSQPESYSSPVQPTEWTPPPAPMAEWQNQNLGVNTPFQPPVSQGQNQTLPIISLVLGIVSLFCCWLGFLLGPAALITGYMGRNNANNNPSMNGGSGLALAGMITGGIGTLISVGYFVLIVIGIVASPR